MPESRVQRMVGGWCAVIGSLAAGIGNALHPATPRDDPRGVAAVIAGSSMWTLIHLVIFVGILLMTYGVVVFAAQLRGANESSSLGPVVPAVLVGCVMGSLTTILDGVAAKQLADAWAADPSEISLTAVTANEMVNFALAGLFNLTFAGIPYVLLGAAIIGSSGVADWIGWIALAAGVFSIAAGGFQLFTGRPTDVSLILTIVGPTVVTLWTMMIGMRLVRDRLRGGDTHRVSRPDSV